MVSAFQELLHFRVDPFQQAHLFSSHLLRVQSQAAVLRPDDKQEVQISLYLILGFFLLAMVSANWSQAIQKALQLGISAALPRKFERKERSRTENSAYLLSGLFLLNIGYLAYSINSSQDLVLKEKSFDYQILFFIGLAILLWSLRWLLDQIILVVSDKARILLEYRTFTWNINRSAGILLFPVAVLTAFSGISPVFLNTLGLALLAALLLFRWIRALLLCLNEEGIGILQILTYFCGLEILPQLVTVKFLVETF